VFAGRWFLISMFFYSLRQISLITLIKHDKIHQMQLKFASKGCEVMASIGTGNMIPFMRERKRWQQAKLWESNHLTLSAITLSRLDNQHQSPYIDTFNEIMAAMKMPVETFFCPYLEGVTIEVLVLRDKLLYELEWAAEDPISLDKAKEMLDRFINMKNFDKGINRQFVLSCQAQVGEIEGMAPDEILKLTKEGIALTYPEFDPNTFDGDILLFEEPNLIHRQAVALARGGDTSAAIALLERIILGLTRLPQDDRDKERKLAPILLSLTQLLMEGGEYTRALEACETGNNVSKRRNKGKYTPDFVYLKAKLLRHLGQQSEVADLLRHAYFGFIARYRHMRADEVMALAKDMGVGFETFGVEDLFVQRPEAVFERGARVYCDSVGDLIFKLRDSMSLRPVDLYKGICAPSTLSKIETSRIKQGSVYFLEGFMQRLGRNIDLYFNTFLSNKDFEDKQMRDEARTLQVNRMYDEAEVLLMELEKKKAYKTGINLQFIKRSKAGIYSSRNGHDDTHMEMLMDTWRVTREDEDIDRIATIRLTNYEILILNSIAINLCENDKHVEGLRIFEDLRNNIKRFYVDGTEKMRTYLLVSYNYSKHLGSTGQHYSVLDIVEEGLNLCLQYGDLKRVAGFAVNKACALLELDEKEKSIPYFAIAYYVSGLFGRAENQRRTRQHVKDRLGITLP